MTAETLTRLLDGLNRRNLPKEVRWDIVRFGDLAWSALSDIIPNESSRGLEIYNAIHLLCDLAFTGTSTTLQERDRGGLFRKLTRLAESPRSIVRRGAIEGLLRLLELSKLEACGPIEGADPVVAERAIESGIALGVDKGTVELVAAWRRRHSDGGK